MHPAFHEGEVALQRRAGADTQLAAIGPRVIRDAMPQQHRDFFAQLPFIVVGSCDAEGQPWASVLAGAPGFVASPAPDLLTVGAMPVTGDPLAAGLRAGARIGVLGIEPHTRRRNRANGRVIEAGEHGFALQVEQSFGNCPKYIQAREAHYVAGAAGGAAAERLEDLDAQARDLIERADTFFIATAHPLSQALGASPQFGVDVSHRGGKPGFVRVDVQARRLTVPDFTGNFYFNTLGNLQLEPRCGLVFIDHASGDLLQVAARAQLVTDAAEVARFAGAVRLLELRVESAVRLRGALPLRWGMAQLSPHLLATGGWR